MFTQRIISNMRMLHTDTLSDPFFISRRGEFNIYEEVLEMICLYTFLIRFLLYIIASIIAHLSNKKGNVRNIIITDIYACRHFNFLMWSPVYGFCLKKTTNNTRFLMLATQNKFHKMTCLQVVTRLSQNLTYLLPLTKGLLSMPFLDC